MDLLTTLDVQEMIGTLLGAFGVGYSGAYLLLFFKKAAEKL
jgi:hypothetical protein